MIGTSNWVLLTGSTDKLYSRVLPHVKCFDNFNTHQHHSHLLCSVLWEQMNDNRMEIFRKYLLFVRSVCYRAAAKKGKWIYVEFTQGLLGPLRIYPGLGQGLQARCQMGYVTPAPDPRYLGKNWAFKWHAFIIRRTKYYYFVSTARSSQRTSTCSWCKPYETCNKDRNAIMKTKKNFLFQ